MTSSIADKKEKFREIRGVYFQEAVISGFYRKIIYTDLNISRSKNNAIILK